MQVLVFGFLGLLGFVVGYFFQTPIVIGFSVILAIGIPSAHFYFRNKEIAYLFAIAYYVFTGVFLLSL